MRVELVEQLLTKLVIDDQVAKLKTEFDQKSNDMKVTFAKSEEMLLQAYEAYDALIIIQYSNLTLFGFL